MKRTSQVVDLGNQSIEIALGFGGRNVFLTVIGARGNRIITVALPRSKPLDLARLLTQAHEASERHVAEYVAEHGTHPR